MNTTLKPVLQPDFGKDKENNLVTVVVQDIQTKRILMVAYADKAAYKETLATGEGVFYSRSRKKRWKKGETSGHTLKVHRVLIDCDGDALIYMVTPKGPTCHTEAGSCFFRHAIARKRLIEPAPNMGDREDRPITTLPVHKWIVKGTTFDFDLSRTTR